MNNILVLTYWSFSDSLIQAYTLPYLSIIRKNLPPGSSIYLLTLEKDEEALLYKNRIAVEQRLQKEGIIWLPFSYKPFGLSAFFLWLRISSHLIKTIIIKKISVIHCWATPAGAIGYLLSILTGRKLIIDSYEPHAEAMVENGTWKRNSLAFRILFWLEKKQTEHAYFLISATEGMRNYANTKFDVMPKNFVVKPACVDLNLFSAEKIKNHILLSELGLVDKIVCVYAGKFGGIYLTNEVFDFFKVAHNFWGDRFHVILLSAHKQDDIEAFCVRANLNPKIITLKFVSHDKVADYMGLADFAITPVKPVPTKRYCTPIKDGEYWALGLPIVIPSGISDDSQIIEENNIGAVLRTLDAGSYMEAIAAIAKLLNEPRKQMQLKIRAIALKYRSFEIAEVAYRKVYDKNSA
jgi:glycosyltransferase involved in cell wall biosynthesis